MSQKALEFLRVILYIYAMLRTASCFLFLGVDGGFIMAFCFRGKGMD